MAKNDVVVRTPADLERKYNLASLFGLKKNVEITAQGMQKIENELNSMLNALIINLKDVLDSQSEISLWFYSGKPTTSNEPYKSWSKPSDHVGDLYYDQNTGYVYQYNGVWEVNTNPDLVEAMAITNAETDTSTDHERKVFFDTPTIPYSNGDWWVKEDGSLFICQISKTSGTYEAADFIDSSKYTESIAEKIGEEIKVLKGTITMITDNYAKFTDLATGGSTTISGDNITTGNIQSQNYIKDTSGTKISLEDGVIDAKNFKVDSSGNVTCNNATIKGTAFMNGSKFVVDKEGNATMTSATVTGAITGSTIKGSTIEGNTITGNTITGGTVSGTKITNGNKFVVDKEGNVTMTSATITNGIINSTNFKVDSSGNITSTGGKIGGWTINNDGLTNGVVFLNKSGKVEIVPPEGDASAYLRILKNKNVVADMVNILPIGVEVVGKNTNYAGTYGYGGFTVFNQEEGYWTTLEETSTGHDFTVSKIGSYSSMTPSGITTPQVTQTSLAEQKKNFEKFENALPILKDIDIYKYNLKFEEEGHKKHIGFVIGEDYKYSSEITALDKEGKEIGVDNYSMTSLCLQAIKEQQEMIEQLKQEIQTLKGGNE